MSNWRYQIFRRKVSKEDRKWLESDYMYGIHEYYPKTEERGAGWTVNPEVHGETVKDVENQLHFMLGDIERYGIKDYDTGENI